MKKHYTIPTFTNLPVQCEPYFNDIIQCRDGWTRFSILMAVNLARLMSRYDTLCEDIEKEGMIVGKRQNIKISMTVTLNKRIQQICRFLQIDAHHLVGRARDQVRRNTVKRRAVSAIESMNDGGLLARPVVKC